MWVTSESYVEPRNVGLSFLTFITAIEDKRTVCYSIFIFKDCRHRIGLKPEIPPYFVPRLLKVFLPTR
jgi:hypothetical protein